MKKRFTIGLLLIVSVCFGLCGFLFGCGGDSIPSEITGVTILGAEVRYNGAEHSVTVSGVLKGDEVYYSETELGPWSERKPAYTVPGKYRVYCKVVRVGFNDFIAFADVNISRGILSGITASDETYIYDGKPHGIKIDGVHDTDSVLYSLDGESFSAELGLVETGEYTVFYRVSSGYSDYADSCTVTVLPNISGTYVDSKSGVAVLSERTAIIGGEEYLLSYGVTGEGNIAGNPFSVKNGVLKYLEAEYNLLGADEYVYRLTAGGDSVYVVAGDTAEFNVEFDNNAASVKSDGSELLSVPSVNYCESVSCGGERRSYETNDVAFTAVAVGRINNIELELSLRGRLEFLFTPQTVLYDGHAHLPELEFDGRVMYNNDDGYTETPPELIEAGSYSIEMVLLSDRFLPEHVTVEFTIMPDISGVYYNSTAVIEITGMNAVLCGTACEYTYSDGVLELAGMPVSVTENGIVVGGTEYAALAARKALVLLDIDGAFIVVVDTVNIDMVVEEGEFTVTVNGEETIRIELGDKTGVRITLDTTVVELTESGASNAVFGKTELDGGTVTYVEIRTF